MSTNENVENEKSSVIGYLKGSVEELSKVTWPTSEMLVRSAAIVLGFCIGLAAYAGVLDALFNWLYTLLLSLR